MKSIEVDMRRFLLIVAAVFRRGGSTAGRYHARGHRDRRT
jgi:hypothetical protein